MREPDYVEWDENGKHYRQVSAAYKRELLADYTRRYSLNTFVETGTCEGDTIAALAPLFEFCFSIELNETAYWAAVERFQNVSSVKIIKGDSGLMLPMLLPILPKSGVLFWLDAHGPNWIGPIVKELEAIFASGIKGVILVDDVDYMPDVLPTHPDWKAETEHGILRLSHVA